MYVATLSRRHTEVADVFGHETWWVTTDSTGFRLKKAAQLADLRIDSNPCMHPAFLSQLLALGPARSVLTASERLQLPVALEIQRSGWAGPDLAEVANRIRAEHATEPEWRIRIRTRRAANAMKAGRGAAAHQLTLEGLAGID